MTDLAQPPVTARRRIAMLPMCWLAASAVAMIGWLIGLSWAAFWVVRSLFF